MQCPETDVHEILYASSKNLMESKTGVQKILNAGIQIVYKLKTRVRMLTWLRFSHSCTFGNQRPH